MGVCPGESAYTVYIEYKRIFEIFLRPLAALLTRERGTPADRAAHTPAIKPIVLS